MDLVEAFVDVDGTSDKGRIGDVAVFNGYGRLEPPVLGA